MERSEQLGEIAAALAKAQAAMGVAKKDAANPYFKSRYADLASIWDACRAALGANGLAISQAPDVTAEGQVGLTTMLLHTSGQYLASRLTLKPAKLDPQGIGSAISYARRYALAAIVGVVAAEEDDDAETASGRGNRHVVHAPEIPAPESDMDAAALAVFPNATPVMAPPAKPKARGRKEPVDAQQHFDIGGRSHVTAGITKTTLLALWDAAGQFDKVRGKGAGKQIMADETSKESSLDLTEDEGQRALKALLAALADATECA